MSASLVTKGRITYRKVGQFVGGGSAAPTHMISQAEAEPFKFPTIKLKKITLRNGKIIKDSSRDKPDGDITVINLEIT